MNALQRFINAALIAVFGAVAMPDVPDSFGSPREGVSAVVAEQMGRLFDAAATDIDRMAARAFEDLAREGTRSAEFRLTRAAQLARQIEQRRAQFNLQARGVITGPAADAVEKAIRRGEREMAELGFDPARRLAGLPGVSFGSVDLEAVRLIAQDTTARAVANIAVELNRAAGDHAGRAVEVFRSLGASVATQADRPGAEAMVNRAIARSIITGNPTLADRAIRDLFRDPAAGGTEGVRKLGNKLIDVGRATMTVRDYAQIVTVTRTREATVAARHERLGVSGIDLVQITGRVSSNFCTAFIGLVCSLNGEQTIDGVTYPAISALPGGGPPFHPRCSKGTTAYVPELVTPRRSAMHTQQFEVFQRRRASGTLLADVRA